MAQAAGHDTNYLALTGALAAIGERGGPPVLPLNLVADFGGGALYLAMGLLAALLETARSGQGQVVDAAMVDGVASMTTLFHGLKAGGMWQEHRGCNVLDGGTPFMRCYRTKDGGYMAVAALENRFYQQLLAGLGLDDVDPRRQMRYEDWPALEKRMAEAFEQRSRDEWQEVFSDRDACIAPVLSFSEATTNPHLEARGTFVEVDGIVQPAPAPRFSRTPGVISSPPCGPGEAETREALSGWGIAETEISRLLEAGTLSVG
jgi:alpha-methylacyl-CoA racemase